MARHAEEWPDMQRRSGRHAEEEWPDMQRRSGQTCRGGVARHAEEEWPDMHRRSGQTCRGGVADMQKRNISPFDIHSIVNNTLNVLIQWP